jgi:hypothetical protein
MLYDLLKLNPEQYGLIEVKSCDNGRLIGIAPFIYTWAIVADLSTVGYEERWCYETLLDAQTAMLDWSGEGEPTGWHRHPLSGRRRDKEGMEYVIK